jgi:hypothetical protein
MRYASIGIAWFSGFVLYSYYHFNSFLPPYYQSGRLSNIYLLDALAGNLISPARGFIVYTPFIFFIVWNLIAHRNSIESKFIVFVAFLAIFSQYTIISFFPHWWAGHSYGPRLMTDIIPWLSVLLIFAMSALANNFAGLSITSKRLYLGFGAFLFSISLWIHAQGAISSASWEWNINPQDIDHAPVRLWDWTNPQFLPGGQSSNTSATPNPK